MAAHRPHDVTQRVSENAHEAADNVRQKVRYVKDEVKPQLRGWLHAATTPLALAAGIVLIVLSPTLTTRVGSAIFVFTALLLFTVSALYHRGNWSPSAHGGSCGASTTPTSSCSSPGPTRPFTLILLEGTARVALLAIVWAGALLGVVFRIFWTDAPRWLYMPIYFALGWAAIFYAKDFAAAGPAVITLIAVGGGLYTLGGLVYGLQQAEPVPDLVRLPRGVPHASRSRRSSATTSAS